MTDIPRGPQGSADPAPRTGPPASRISPAQWLTVRRWLYGIAIALIPIAVSTGWIEPPMAGLLIPLVVAILNPTRPDPEGGDSL